MMPAEKVLLPTVYLGNIQYYKLLTAAQEASTEIHEHFIKQTYRNRCRIYGANGALNLIIPLKKWPNNTPVKDIRIAYDCPWQQLHWRSLEAAYRSSSYFEFYEDDLIAFYEQKQFDFLIDFNEALQTVLLDALNMTSNVRRTSRYMAAESEYTNFLKELTPKQQKVYNFPRYFQVFENKYGFLENLSIVDLLFNVGPEASSYIKNELAL